MRKMAEATQSTTYRGNCHCGSFQFQLHMNTPLETAFTCCCVICAKKGYLWVFPREKDCVVTRGNDTLASYKPGDNSEHYFCPACGTAVLARNHLLPTGGSGLAVNTRALLNTNPFSLRVESLNADLPSMYTPPAFSGPIPEVSGEFLEVYTGGCYCGAVTLMVKTKPLPEIEVKEDNCSICQRNANVCIYPDQSEVSIVGDDNMTEYRFARKFTGHRFCKVCGVQVYMKLHGPPKALVDSLPLAKQKIIRQKLSIVPIRIAALDGVEFSLVKIQRSDEGTEGYAIGNQKRKGMNDST